MPAPTLEGIFAPVVTPFDARGDVSTAAFRANIEAHLDAGLAGVVVSGSSGEAPLLSEDERATLVSLARAAVPDGRQVIAGER